MNLIEGLVVITVLSVLCLGVTDGLHDDGLVGGIAGGVWAAIGIVMFATSIRLSFNLWYRLFPLRPRCATGKCTSGDYTLDTRAVNCLDWRCACGDRYRQRWPHDGAPARFTRLDDAGDEQPFRVRRWMCWVSPPDPTTFVSGQSQESMVLRALPPASSLQPPASSPS